MHLFYEGLLLLKGETMKAKIVSVKEIGVKDNGKLNTRFRKEIETAMRLHRYKALKLTYSREVLSDKARETISAVIKRNKLKLKVFKRGLSVYITKV